LSVEVGLDCASDKRSFTARIILRQLSQLLNVLRHQPKPTDFRAELILHGQLERRAMNRSQVFCSGVV